MQTQEISERIQAIIDKRHERIPIIDRKLKTLDAIQQAADSAEALRKEMIDADGNILPGPHAAILGKQPDVAIRLQQLDFESVRKAVLQSKTALEDYRNRCSRETVNIAVVGRARIGKSELLKDISGLGNKVIPAFDDSDCTGAPSVITNVPGSKLSARLTFRSPEAMRQIVQGYLDVMIPDLSKRPILRSMEEIRTLDLEKVENVIPYGHPEKHLLKFLKYFVEHYGDNNGTEGWAKFAGAAPLTLFDEDEIATFVAQNNGFGKNDPQRRNYYKYLVVESCEITCSFPKNIGKICLIDTVGLGDTALGIEDEMLRTIGERSDAVTIVHCPQNLAGGGAEDKIKELQSKIYTNFSDRNLNDWLFWLLNRVDVQRIKPPFYNREICTDALEDMRNTGWAGSKTAKIVSVIDKNEVEQEFLMPMLESIAEKLDSIDQIFCDKVNAALENLQVAYRRLCDGAKKALHSDMRSNINLTAVVSNFVDQKIVDIRSKLFAISSSWRAKRDEPCVEVNDAATAIIKKMYSTGEEAYLTPKDEILNVLNTGKLPPEVYIECANEIRNKISKDFLNVDIDLRGVIVNMKNEIAKTMYDDLGLKKLCPEPENSDEAYHWLDDFCATILSNEYPEIKLAMKTVADFDFSVKGFLTYEVRNCLDLLDMRFHNTPNVSFDNISKTASDFYWDLHKILGSIAGNLKVVLKELYIKPNRAMFAEVADFCDRIYYTDKVKSEWKILLMDQAPLLWSDELRNSQEQGIALQQWLDKVEALQAQNVSSVFRI